MLPAGVVALVGGRGGDMLRGEGGMPGGARTGVLGPGGVMLPEGVRG